VGPVTQQADPSTGEITTPITRLPDGRTIDQVWEQLREPFAPSQIGKLPKGGDDVAKSAYQRCEVCKQKAPPHHWHVDYVGHAIVTDRLNRVVGTDGWSYTRPERVHDDRGKLLAVISEMTILGHTKGIEVGGPATSASTYAGQLKTAISDYICRAAMRFGVALDLWAKQELESLTYEDRQDTGQADSHRSTQGPEVGATSPAPASGSTSNVVDLNRINSPAKAKAYIKGQSEGWRARFMQHSAAAPDDPGLKGCSELVVLQRLIARTNAELTGEQATGGTST
jgi:hypothetical protein